MTLRNTQKGHSCLILKGAKIVNQPSFDIQRCSLPSGISKKMSVQRPAGLCVVLVIVCLLSLSSLHYLLNVAQDNTVKSLGRLGKSRNTT